MTRPAGFTPPPWPPRPARRLDSPPALRAPSHQYPTGATLSLARRLQLLEWAGPGTLVVEDDHDSELRYAGPPSRPCRAWTAAGLCGLRGAAPASSSRPSGWAGSWPRRPWLRPWWRRSGWPTATPTLDQQVLTDFITGATSPATCARPGPLRGRAPRPARSPGTSRLPPGRRKRRPADALYLPPGAAESAVVRAGARGGGSIRSAPATGRAPARRGCSWATAPWPSRPSPRACAPGPGPRKSEVTAAGAVTRGR